MSRRGLPRRPAQTGFRAHAPGADRRAHELSARAARRTSSPAESGADAAVVLHAQVRHLPPRATPTRRAARTAHAADRRARLRRSASGVAIGVLSNDPALADRG